MSVITQVKGKLILNEHAHADELKDFAERYGITGTFGKLDDEVRPLVEEWLAHNKADVEPVLIEDETGVHVNEKSRVADLYAFARGRDIAIENGPPIEAIASAIRKGLIASAAPTVDCQESNSTEDYYITQVRGSL